MRVVHACGPVPELEEIDPVGPGEFSDKGQGVVHGIVQVIRSKGHKIRRDPVDQLLILEASVQLFLGLPALGDIDHHRQKMRPALAADDLAGKEPFQDRAVFAADLEFKVQNPAFNLQFFR